MPELAGVILFALALAVAVLLIIYVVVPLFALVGKLIGHVFSFIGSTFRDALRGVSAIITMVVLAPLIVGTIVIGRWSTTAHLGRAVQYECVIFGRCLYRLAIGNPARLLGLSVLTEGIEKRIPEAVGNAPRADTPSRRTGQFDGYTIVGSLPVGGSGARMFIAEPDEKKLASFARAGHTDLDQVVIKSFSVRDGSSLPQIIRESRALEAAKKLGLILDHELNEHRFHYVMEYIPGDNLSVTTNKLHDESGPDGLGTDQLAQAIGYTADLLTILDRYHRGGLWHKDVKPDNIIVNEGQVHLVDLGLVTPMRSAMTLTTHGTEYFRDPEMVRMALKGVKVHEVDGAKFDIFAIGAVLYSLIENSFPAHGGLSRFTKQCPDALRLIIRRAMSDYNSRYTATPEMLADLSVVMNAANPYDVKPADLPSMSSKPAEVVAAAEEEVQQSYAPVQPAPAAADPAFAPAPQQPVTPAPKAPAGARRNPRLHVTNWMRGRYVSDNEPAHVAEQASYSPASPVRRSPRPTPVPAGSRRSAAEQLQRAQSRAKAARKRAHDRMRSHRQARGHYSNKPNVGVAIGIGIVVALFAAVLLSPILITLLMRAANSPAPQALVFIDKDDAATLDADLSDNEVARRIVESLYSTLESFDTMDWDTIGPQLKETFKTILAEGARYSNNTPAAPVFVPTQGELLVLDDLSPTPPATRMDILDRLISNAHQIGFALRGLDPNVDETELLAHARKAFGDPAEESSQRQVRSWLAQQPDSVKGIIRLHWVGGDGDQSPAIQVVTRLNMDADWLMHQLQTN